MQTLNSTFRKTGFLLILASQEHRQVLWKGHIFCKYTVLQQVLLVLKVKSTIIEAEVTKITTKIVGSGLHVQHAK